MNTRTEIWNGHEIRFVETEPSEWWAVAKDISDALDYSETSAMTRHLKDKFFMSVKLTGMNMKSTLVSEFGIYKAIFNSHKPEAESFQEWVFEMLKELRQQSGLEGFQVFRMMDKQHQREAMSKLSQSLQQPKRINFIKGKLHSQ